MILPPRHLPNVADPNRARQVRVGSGDPGGQDNAFAFVLTQVDKIRRKIFVIGANDWYFENGQIDYPQIEEDLAKIHEKAKLSFFVVEQNNTGLHVVQTMRRVHHIKTAAVTSANRIKSPEIIRKGETMDKFEHAGWINAQRIKGNILFPKNKTPEIKKMISQIESFVRTRTKGGQIKLAAEGQEEDDYVMAFMINTFFIRKKLFGDGNSGNHRVLTKKYETEKQQVDLGTGIPPNSVILGHDILMPIGQLPGGYRIR